MVGNGMELIRAQRGLVTRIAKRFGITAGAVSQWSRVPAERVVEIERISGISRTKLRPDLYDFTAAPPAAPPAASAQVEAA